jgi:4-alpha-glucanotransferase
VTTHDLATLAGYWQGQDIEARRAAGLLPDPASYTGQWDERRRDRQALLDALRGAKLLPQGCPLDASKVPALDDALRHAAIEFLARTPCELLVLNQEDLTGEVWQQNLPGSTSEYPNWKRKMRIAVESLDELNTAAISALLRRTGRRGE